MQGMSLQQWNIAIIHEHSCCPREKNKVFPCTCSPFLCQRVAINAALCVKWKIAMNRTFCGFAAGMEFHWFGQLINFHLQNMDLMLGANVTPLKNTLHVWMTTCANCRTLCFLDGMSRLLMPTLAVWWHSACLCMSACLRLVAVFRQLRCAQAFGRTHSKIYAWSALTCKSCIRTFA
jgi:hypothetical protein